MYAPAPHLPLSRSSSPAPNANMSPNYNYSTPRGPSRPLSRGPSPIPPAAGPGYYGGYPTQINRSSSPIPGQPQYPVYIAPIQRSISGQPPGPSNFNVEKRPKSPNTYGRPNLPPVEQGFRDEVVFREHVSTLIAAKDRQFAVNGHIPADPSQLMLFFRGKNQLTYGLEFPIDTTYNRNQAPPSFEVLAASCKPRPRTTSDYDAYGEREALCYPANLPLSATLELTNYPILDAVRNALFPVLPAGQHLIAKRDGLDLIDSGAYIASYYPSQLRNDGRAATIVVTLPVRYRGGEITVINSEGRHEKFLGSGGKNGEIDWVAFRSDCAYGVESVTKGCLLTINYAVFIKGFGPASPSSDTLVTPSNYFFDLLSPILNMSRGKIAFFLTHSYNVNPAEAIANSIVPLLKGADALLYDAFKFHKLDVNLHWTAGGYIWPLDKDLEAFGDEIELPLHRNSPSGNRASFGLPHQQQPQRFSGGVPVVDYNSEEAESLRMRVRATGGIHLTEAGISLLADYKNPTPTISKERVYFSANGELEKLIVNLLLVVYIP